MVRGDRWFWLSVEGRARSVGIGAGSRWNIGCSLVGVAPGEQECSSLSGRGWSVYDSQKEKRVVDWHVGAERDAFWAHMLRGSVVLGFCARQLFERS